MNIKSSTRMVLTLIWFLWSEKFCVKYHPKVFNWERQLLLKIW